ncbi:MAG: DUF429 domain-containing protein [Oscillatoriales cyanobacterium RM1_1_9]|nr:DUF429 domain-containing protein [Oscillatoriales cyanobacterium RM1_1_9]
MAKIREVDEWLQSSLAPGIIRECHPEICFWALNHQTVVNSRKKTETGIEERLEILSHYCQNARTIVTEAQSRYRRKDLAVDDIVDALACAVGATFYPALKTLPDQPERDQIGLPMEIVYPDLSSNSKD